MSEISDCPLYLENIMDGRGLSSIVRMDDMLQRELKLYKTWGTGVFCNYFQMKTVVFIHTNR